jgi:hypothetical protein
MPVPRMKFPIKHRKRISRARQGTQASGFNVDNRRTGLSGSDGNLGNGQKGTINADGSANLGSKAEHESWLLQPPHPPSPSNFGQGIGRAWEPTNKSSSAINPGSKSERAKAERRAELQGEVERMREALKAKEKELEELNDVLAPPY